MTIEEVKQIIKDSKFNPDLKNQLVLLLPRLAKNTLNGLVKEISRGDSVLAADYLVSLWEKFANVLDGVKTKNETAVANLLNFMDDGIQRFGGEYEIYVLNLVLDARSLVFSGKLGIPEAVYFKLLEYEIWSIWRLPQEEVLFLLKNYALNLAKNTNLLTDMQAVVYTNDWDYDKDFSQVFSNALLQNKEVLGNNSNSTVGFWIKECINYSTHNKSKITTFQVANFLTKDPAIQKLEQAEKIILSDILNLYVWFFEPRIDVDEIIKYKEEVTDKRAEEIEKREYQNAEYSQQSSPSQEISESLLPQKASAPITFIPPILKPIDKIQMPVALKSIIPPLKPFSPPFQNTVLPPSLPKANVNKVPDETRGKIDKKLEELEKRVDFKN
jgi:tetrahydromethanopterin S-methyltransferase subunit G